MSKFLFKKAKLYLILPESIESLRTMLHFEVLIHEHHETTTHRTRRDAYVEYG